MSLPHAGAPRSDEPLITPTAEEWSRMTAAEEQAFMDRVYATLRAERMRVGEGVPHHRSREGSLSMLREYFRRVRRRIYLAADLPVLYPGETPCSPDVMAVLDVADEGEADERGSWNVVREGRGLDLALEILVAGDRRKDLYDNVVKYARLGITEYFVYDRAKQRVLGYRLPDEGAEHYQPIRPHFGRLPSQVLDLELGVLDGRLRFFHGEAELPSQDELLERVNTLLVGVEERAESEAKRAESEAKRAAEADQRAASEAKRAAEADQRAESEAKRAAEADQRAESEAKRAEAEAKRAESEAKRAAAALLALRVALLTLLRVRGVSLSDRGRAVVEAASDAAVLAAWLARAETVATEDALFAP